MLDSLEPEVKTTWDGPTSSSAAMDSVALASACRAARPMGWLALGLAGNSAWALQKAATTAGSAGVLAA